MVEVLGRFTSWQPVSVLTGPLLGLLAYALGGSLDEPARVMLGIFTLTAAYWTLGSIPPFGTAILAMTLMTFLLGIPAGNGADEGGVKGWTEFIAPAAAPVIVLMLGGFVMGRTAHLLRVDVVLARALIRPFAKTPALTLLGVMLVTAGFSMWMSNTATAAMMRAIVAPIAVAVDRDRLRGWPGARRARAPDPGRAHERLPARRRDRGRDRARVRAGGVRGGGAAAAWVKATSRHRAVGQERSPPPHEHDR